MKFNRLDSMVWLVTVTMMMSLMSGSVHAEAYLSDFMVTGAVDSYTFAPKAEQTQFTDDVKEIWASAFLNQAPEGTLVEADWRLLREGQYQKILGSRLEAEGDRYFAARIHPSEGERLPAGEYQVIFKLNGEKQASVDFQISAVSVAKTPPRSCVPPQETDAELIELVGSKEAQEMFNLGRYNDPEGRFSLIVPGAWFPADREDPNEALFLSQNMENDPIAWFVVHVYNAHLTPKFTALDTVNQLRDMLLKEGTNHGAVEVPISDVTTEKLAENVASGSLALTYESAAGEQIAQIHMLMVDGQFGFNIQVTVEDEGELGEVAGYLLSVASSSLWTPRLCEAGIAF